MADGPSARPNNPRTNDKIWPMFSEIGRIVRGGFPDRGSCIGSLQEHGDEAIFRAALGNGRCGRAVHGSQRAPPSKRYHPRSKRRNGSPDLFASISTRGLLEPPSTTRCGFSHGAAIFGAKALSFRATGCRVPSSPLIHRRTTQRESVAEGPLWREHLAPSSRRRFPDFRNQPQPPFYGRNLPGRSQKSNGNFGINA